MSGKYFLTNIADNKEFELVPPAMVIGRSDECDLVVQEGQVSRKHAKILIGNNSATIEDLGSTNGTYVNNIKVKKSRVLESGDVIAFDVACYVYQAENEKEKTVMMSRIKSSGSQSSMTDNKQKTSNNQTMFRDVYQMPPGWEDYESDTSDTPKVTPDIIDFIVNRKLKGKNHNFKAVMVVVSGDNKSRVFGFAPNPADMSGQWKIGRDARCHMAVDDLCISNLHAVLICKAGRWGIMDYRSTNGMKVNGEKTARAELKDYDVVSLGSVSIGFKTL